MLQKTNTIVLSQTQKEKCFFNAFTIPNNADGFHDLFQKISSLTNDFSNVKVGLEATGHYNYNLLGFLIDKGLPTFVINPLHTNLFRKSLSLRQTKTDKSGCPYDCSYDDVWSKLTVLLRHILSQRRA